MTKDGDSCLYRGANGLRCGIGHIITNDELKLLKEIVPKTLKEKDKLNSASVRKLHEAMRKKGFVKNKRRDVQSDDLLFLKDIQEAHDNAGMLMAFHRKPSKQFIRDFKEKMKEIENEYFGDNV